MGIARSTVYGPPPVETDDTALVEAISAITGEFEAYGNSMRRYCTHSCYIQHRFGTRGGRR